MVGFTKADIDEMRTILERHPNKRISSMYYRGDGKTIHWISDKFVLGVAFVCECDQSFYAVRRYSGIIKADLNGFWIDPPVAEGIIIEVTYWINDNPNLYPIPVYTHKQHSLSISEQEQIHQITREETESALIEWIKRFWELGYG